MPETANCDLLIIGGGPAGYVGAIRAAQLGMKVVCVERERLGGVCLNWGCIPTKALLAAAEFYYQLRHQAADWGIAADNVRHDWSKVIGRSRGVADTLNRGVQGLFKKNRVEHVSGHGRIARASDKGCVVEVHDQPGHVGRTIQARSVLICTGANPRSLPGIDFDHQLILNARDAMTLPQQPGHLLVIGAGAIGVEFAYFYNAFGTKVTLVEMLDRLLPAEDAEVSAALLKAFKQQGIDCRLATRTQEIRPAGSGIEAVLALASAASDKKPSDASKAAHEIIVADKVLLAVGVSGRFDGLFDEAMLAQVRLDRGHISVDKQNYQTSLPSVYAAGDVIGPPWLAHVASEEAVVCVERLAGHHPQPINYDAIPGCTYCQPQVASLGFTQAQCDKLGLKYKVGKFPFLASGKAQTSDHAQGFVKLIVSEKYGEILGAHMIGHNVTELIAELGLAKSAELTADEVIATMHAHPTLSEAIHEAALGTGGRMIHF